MFRNLVQTLICGKTMEPTARDYVMFFIAFVPITVVLVGGVISLLYVVTVILLPWFWSAVAWVVFIGIILYICYRANK